MTTNSQTWSCERKRSQPLATIIKRKDVMHKNPKFEITERREKNIILDTDNNVKTQENF